MTVRLYVKELKVKDQFRFGRKPFLFEVSGLTSVEGEKTELKFRSVAKPETEHTLVLPDGIVIKLHKRGDT